MSLSWWGYLGLIICCYRTFEIQSRCSMYTLASCWAEWPLGERSRESLLCRPDPVDAARRVAWVRCSARGQGVRRVWVASAFVSYGAKRLVLIVLLFGMLLALFQNTWVGGQGFALGIGNYLAIVCSSLSILLAVLSHVGALGPTESAVAGDATASGATAERADADGDGAEPVAAEADAADRARARRAD